MVVINHPEKHSKPRIVRISDRLLSLILQQPRHTEYIFRIKNNAKSDRILSYFWQKRKEVSQKVNNPNLMRINFKSLRHFKATKEYYASHHPLRDPLIITVKSHFFVKGL